MAARCACPGRRHIGFDPGCDLGVYANINAEEAVLEGSKIRVLLDRDHKENVAVVLGVVELLGEASIRHEPVVAGRPGWADMRSRAGATINRLIVLRDWSAEGPGIVCERLADRYGVAVDVLSLADEPADELRRMRNDPTLRWAGRPAAAVGN
jgi:hypothetical protein